MDNIDIKNIENKELLDVFISLDNFIKYLDKEVKDVEEIK